jgi:hypothetical protein
MKKLFTLSLFLLIAASSISQNDYPKLTVISGDTLILLKPADVTKLNLTFIQLDYEKALNTVLSDQINLQSKIIENDKTIQSANDSVMLKSLIIEQEKSKQIELLSNTVKNQQKRIVVLKKSRTLLTIGVGLLGIVTTYWIMKP